MLKQPFPSPARVSRILQEIGSIRMAPPNSQKGLREESHREKVVVKAKGHLAK
jgi:hypothetical protein